MGPRRPSLMWSAIEGGDKWFYQHYFQEPGKAESDMESDVHEATRKSLYGASGDAPPADRFEHLFPRNQRPLDRITVPKEFPSVAATKAD